MKKILLFVLLFFVFMFRVGAISSEVAIVMDADSKRVLFEKNISKQKLIASTTKIMSAIIALEYGDVESLVVVDEEVLRSYGSAIYIQIGEELTLRDLIYGLMLRSGNDAAVAIAKNVGGSIEAFTLLMNEKAKEIGMSNTIFLNSHGLEENDGNGNMSTAYDMALLMRYAMQNDEFREITRTKSITVKSNYKTYVWGNKNKLLNMYEYATGGKTGYTQKAKRTLVTSASRDDKNLIVVTLNDGNDFNNHESLYTEYFSKYEVAYILDKANFKVDDNKFEDAKLYIEQSFKMLITKNERAQINIKIKLDDVDVYNDNDLIGRAEIYLADKLVHFENIYIKKETSSEHSFWQKIMSWFKKW